MNSSVVSDELMGRKMYFDVKSQKVELGGQLRDFCRKLK
jgi:hypothetical protein